MSDLRATMAARCDEIRAKIAARQGQAGYQQNVEQMKTTLGELERLLASVPEGN